MFGTGNTRSMGLLAFLIITLFIGLSVGAIARLLLPGPDPMSMGTTAVIGVAGSLIAGLFSWYVLHRHGAGLILSVVFSMLLVWLYRRSARGQAVHGSGLHSGGRRRRW